MEWDGVNKLHLYKLVFPPDNAQASIAFIGYFQPIGAVNPISEQQARWAVAVIKGTAALPPPSLMHADIAKRNAAIAKRYYASQKHTVQVTRKKGPPS